MCTLRMFSSMKGWSLKSHIVRDTADEISFSSGHVRLPEWIIYGINVQMGESENDCLKE